MFVQGGRAVWVLGGGPDLSAWIHQQAEGCSSQQCACISNGIMGPAPHLGATPCDSSPSWCPVPITPFHLTLLVMRDAPSPVPVHVPSRGELCLFSLQPCLQYWPELGLQQYGPMEVEYISGAADEDIVSRLFRVQNITRVRVSPLAPCQWRVVRAGLHSVCVCAPQASPSVEVRVR